MTNVAMRKKNMLALMITTDSLAVLPKTKYVMVQMTAQMVLAMKMIVEVCYGFGF